MQTTANGGMAGELGFEPRQAESESAVLPLDDPPKPGSGGMLLAEAGVIAAASTLRKHAGEAIYLCATWRSAIPKASH